VSEKGPVSEVGLGFDDSGIGSELVLDFEETRTESPLIFEDYSKDTFDKVAELEIDEALETLREPVPSTPVGETLTREGMKKKRIKTTVGQTDLPLVRKFLAQQSKPSFPSLHRPSTSSKPTLKSIRKYFRLATHGLPKKTNTSKRELW